MINYIKQLSEKDILDLGKTLTGKISTRLKKYEIKDGVLCVDFRIDQNVPKGKSVLEHSKIYSVNAEFSDYGINGTINSFYPLNKERYFDRFAKYMINRFGKDYAVGLYNYHKSMIDEIEIFAKNFKQTSQLTQDNPDVSSYFVIKAQNMLADYNKKLDNLKTLINENLYGKDKIEDFDILNNI